MGHFFASHFWAVVFSHRLRESGVMIEPQHPIRIVRPCRDLPAAEWFWCEGIGLTLLDYNDPVATGEPQRVVVGIPGASWVLVLVEDPKAAPSPGDMLVIDRGRPLTNQEHQHILHTGGRIVPARDSYWDKVGVTVQDPNGYLLVLSHRPLS